MNLNVKKFKSKGWQVVRDVFSTEEIDKFRNLVIESNNSNKINKNTKVDLLADQYLSAIVHDSRILSIARKLLGSDDIVYFGDSTYAIIGDGYSESEATGYHRDNTDRSDVNAPDWHGEYTLIRFGIYLQDHSAHSGGLMVRDKSHKHIKIGWANYLIDRYLNTKVGDVGVWNMRIQHSGVGRYWRGFPSLGIPPHLFDRIPKFLQSKKWEKTRIAIWVSYGLNDRHLHRHLDYLMTRSERVEMWQHANYSKEVLKDCESARLNVVDMPSRIRLAIKNGQQVGQNLHHKAFPY